MFFISFISSLSLRKPEHRVTLQKGQSQGKELAYLDFNDVIVDLLAQDSAKGTIQALVFLSFLPTVFSTHKTDMLFKYHFEGLYDHPTSSDGCREYQRLCDEKTEKYGELFKLLLPMFYLDEYEHNTTRHQSFLGVYMILANLPKEVL